MALLLCFGMLPTTAWALEISGNGWKFDLSDMSNPVLVIENDEGMSDWIENGGSYRGIVLSVDLTEGVTKIPYHAFYKCASLSAVELPASVKTIGKNDVFEGCSNLKEITVAQGNEHFAAEDGILYNADKTEVLVCPPGKTDSVKLPDTVVTIAGSAFKGCAGLTALYLHEGISRIENVAFEDCGLTTITLPATLGHLGNGAFQNCDKLAELNVADGNAEYSSENGVLYDKGKACLLTYPAAKTDVDFEVPDSVAVIADNALSGNSHLQSVTAGNLESIGDSAFKGCATLESFKADSLCKVEAQAFYGCSMLESVDLGEREESLVSIEMGAFSDCSSLTAAPLSGAIYIGGGVFRNCVGLTELAFCETGDVEIAENAFFGCTGLTELTFPKNVVAIGSKAFDGCTKVTVVTFENSEPPTCGDGIVPVGNVSEFQIIVPSGSEEAYRTALGETLGSYVGDTLVRKYPIFVNGQQFTSENTSIACGQGTASFDAETSTLTLSNASIDTMGGDYGYGGASNSGLAKLTIKLVGTNEIHAEQEEWGYVYRDSINSGANCDVVIQSGEMGGDLPSLTCDLIDMGRGNAGYTGGEGQGNLVVDGVKLTVNDGIFVHHDITFQNGAHVNVLGNVTANHDATFTVEGETTEVTVKAISMGNGTAFGENDNKLALEDGVLTLPTALLTPIRRMETRTLTPSTFTPQTLAALL